MEEHEKQLEEKIKTLEANLKFLRWKNGIMGKLQKRELKQFIFFQEQYRFI